ncbi:hypothetical protein DLREEDagrD3_26080 [Denitratisoma sp. agr-D3]
MKKPAAKSATAKASVAKKPVAASKTAAKKAPAKKPAVKAVSKPTVKAAPVKRAAARPAGRSVKPGAPKTGEVLNELKSLAKELSKAAKGLGKSSTSDNPKSVANILGSVERMTSDAANKSLLEAEAAKAVLDKLKLNLGKDWSRKDIEAALKLADDHLTNIIVAQEFQDLAGQALRKSMKALVGAIIVVEGGGTIEENRLTQSEVDNLLNELMP